jgi:hypothetical protein
VIQCRAADPTEQRAGSAKSVFHFDVQGSVAKSTHAGIPWLLYLRQRLGGRLHFWPFDGWSIPAGKSAVVEAYPSLWKDAFPADDRTPDQHDAFTVASWLSEADRSGQLARYLQPNLTPSERTVAGVEGCCHRQQETRQGPAVARRAGAQSRPVRVASRVTQPPRRSGSRSHRCREEDGKEGRKR